MPSPKTPKNEPSGKTDTSLLEELDRYRRRVRELERTLADRDRDEAQYRNEVSRLAQAFQPARIRVWRWGAESRLTQYIPLRGDVRDSWGRSASDISLAEERLLDAVHPDDRKRLARVWDQANKEHTPYEIEYRIVHSDGTLRHQHEIGTPDFDETGLHLGHFGTTQDITERKQAEEALRESEERYRTLFDQSPIGIWEEDYSGVKRIIDGLRSQGVHDFRQYFRENPKALDDVIEAIKLLNVNPAAVRIYGAPDRGAFMRWAREPAYLASLKEFYLNEIALLAEGKSPNVGESTVISCDGTPVVTRTITLIAEIHKGTWDRIISTEEDITEMKQAEARLRQTQKMEAVGQLTGGVAHDFNNLLAVIMGNAELLTAQLGNDNRPTQAVLRATHRGAELTQRLLAFARNQSLRPQSINIHAVVTEISYMLHRILGETIKLEIRMAPDLWRVFADPGQLEAAILNLAINARDAMPDGGKLIIESTNAPLDDGSVASHGEVTPGDYVMLSVSDTGIGMGSEALEHAFEPFFTTKDVGEGSGLGLSMVYGFVKQSGGEVVIDSEEGRGSTLRLYLPRARAAANEAGQEVPAKEPRARGETVLVVEDDPDVRAFVGAMLEDLGYGVLTAEEGRAGLAALEKAPRVDLLLSDVMLPGAMSGPELAEQAKRRNPGLEILFMSGYAESAVHDHSPLPEEAALLNKPFRKRELAQKVRAVLDR